jgi:hypothetical protein
MTYAWLIAFSRHIVYCHAADYAFIAIAIICMIFLSFAIAQPALRLRLGQRFAAVFAALSRRHILRR